MEDEEEKDGSWETVTYTVNVWKIIYRIDNNIVNVLIIIDSRRNTQDILIEKLIK